MSTGHSLRRDIEHLAENLNLNIGIPLIFYLAFGFERFGLSHLLFLIPYSLWIYCMDDALESRSFPRHLAPLILLSLAFSPLLTAVVVVGEVLINLKDLLRRESFALELVEGLGNTLIYVAPFYIPLGINDPALWIATIGFVTAVNCFHKIGHRETVSYRLSLVLGYALAFASGLYIGLVNLYIWSLLALTGSVMMYLVYIVRERWFYNHVFQSYIVASAIPFVAFYVLQ